MKPAMYATTGFVISASMNAAAFSSSSPPISPTMTTCPVCESASNSASISRNDEPTMGSPPIPTIVEFRVELSELVADLVGQGSRARHEPDPRGRSRPG